MTINERDLDYGRVFHCNGSCCFSFSALVAHRSFGRVGDGLLHVCDVRYSRSMFVMYGVAVPCFTGTRASVLSHPYPRGKLNAFLICVW